MAGAKGLPHAWRCFGFDERATAHVLELLSDGREPACRISSSAPSSSTRRAITACRGVTRARLPAGNEVVCTLRDPRVAALAAEVGNTRSAAALELWRDRMEGALVAIGNAPTALFYLIGMLRAGAPRPAAVIGMPVGFVGAAESKQALAESGLGIPYAIVRGRLGGSAMTAAAVNALSRAGL